MSFKLYRKRAGLTQEKVAEILGVDRTTISKWDVAKNIPRGALLPQIASLYGCTLDELLSCDEPEPYKKIIQEMEGEQNV